MLFDIVDIEEGIRGWRWFILLFGFVYPGTRKLMFSQRWVLVGVYLLLVSGDGLSGSGVIHPVLMGWMIFILLSMGIVLDFGFRP